MSILLSTERKGETEALSVERSLSGSSDPFTPDDIQHAISIANLLDKLGFQSLAILSRETNKDKRLAQNVIRHCQQIMDNRNNGITLPSYARGLTHWTYDPNLSSDRQSFCLVFTTEVTPHVEGDLKNRIQTDLAKQRIATEVVKKGTETQLQIFWGAGKSSDPVYRWLLEDFGPTFRSKAKGEEAINLRSPIAPRDKDLTSLVKPLMQAHRSWTQRALDTLNATQLMNLQQIFMGLLNRY